MKFRSAEMQIDSKTCWGWDQLPSPWFDGFGLAAVTDHMKSKIGAVRNTIPIRHIGHKTF